MAGETESRLTPGLGFHLGENGQWEVEEIPEDVLTTGRFSGYLTIHGYRCTVFETPSKDQWAQKSVGTVASLHNIAARLATTEDANFVYHVTYYGYLPSIESMGIVPTAGGVLEQNGTSGQEKLFVSGKEGIPYWYDRLGQHAPNLSEDLLESGHIPTVLRFMSPKGLVQDELGVRESGQESYYAAQEISPDGIEVWNGKEWSPIYNWETIDPMTALNASYHDEDGEEVTNYSLKPALRNLLIPR